MESCTDVIALPVCVGESNCACFNKLFRDQDVFTKTSVLDYTIYNFKEITKYLTEISKHLNRDRLLKEHKFSQLPAYEVKQANDHFQESIFKLQTYISQARYDGTFCFYYFGKLISAKQIKDLFEKIAVAQDSSLIYLNQPESLVSISYLSDILHLHQVCLYILQQFYHLVTYGKPIYLESTPHLNIHGFHFCS